VPSLNELFKMNHWGRLKEKKATQAAFMSALRHTVNGSLTQIIFAKNISSTASGMRVTSKMTGIATSRSRLLKSKSSLEPASEPKLR